MKHFLTRLIFPCLCVGVLFWFHWNSVEGRRGELQIAQTEKQIVKAKSELDGLIAQRKILTHKVALLRSHALDPDLLGVQARKMLHHSHPDELIIYLPKQQVSQ
ncbi:MAG: septum formation initiator family protein [Rhizobiales bacterium]|nr:septum formation initiator family protein [Hyphomicrobiales bacterium]